MLNYIPSKAVLKKLTDILECNQAAKDVKGGICEVIDMIDGYKPYHQFFMDRSENNGEPSIFGGWGFWTGNTTFPVPASKYNLSSFVADEAYNSAANVGRYMVLWTGEQLDLRCSLIAHLLKVWHKEFDLSSQFEEIGFNYNKLEHIT